MRKQKRAGILPLKKKRACPSPLTGSKTALSFCLRVSRRTLAPSAPAYAGVSRVPSVCCWISRVHMACYMKNITESLYNKRYEFARSFSEGEGFARKKPPQSAAVMVFFTDFRCNTGWSDKRSNSASWCIAGGHVRARSFPVRGSGHRPGNNASELPDSCRGPCRGCIRP